MAPAPNYVYWNQYVHQLAAMLGLEKWEIEVLPPKKGHPRKGNLAQVGTSPKIKRAEIVFALKHFQQTPEQQRATAIHELLHLHTDAIYTHFTLMDKGKVLKGRPFRGLWWEVDHSIEVMIEEMAQAIAPLFPLPNPSGATEVKAPPYTYQVNWVGSSPEEPVKVEGQQTDKPIITWPTPEKPTPLLPRDWGFIPAHLTTDEEIADYVCTREGKVYKMTDGKPEAINSYGVEMFNDEPISANPGGASESIEATTELLSIPGPTTTINLPEGQWRVTVADGGQTVTFEAVGDLGIETSGDGDPELPAHGTPTTLADMPRIQPGWGVPPVLTPPHWSQLVHLAPPADKLQELVEAADTLDQVEKEWRASREQEGQPEALEPLIHLDDCNYLVREFALAIGGDIWSHRYDKPAVIPHPIDALTASERRDINDGRREAIQKAEALEARVKTHVEWMVKHKLEVPRFPIMTAHGMPAPPLDQLTKAIAYALDRDAWERYRDSLASGGDVEDIRQRRLESIDQATKAANMVAINFDYQDKGLGGA